MSTIDLGDNPVGSTPTEAQKTQLRSAIGLGSSDTVDFDAINTEALLFQQITELEALSSPRDSGSFLVAQDTKASLYFATSDTPVYLGGDDKNTYFVNPASGNDTHGSAGASAFKTVGAAIDQAIIDLPDGGNVCIELMAGVYDTADATNPQSYTSNTASSVFFSIKFNEGAVLQLSASPFIDNTSGDLLLLSIGGFATITQFGGTLYKGPSRTTSNDVLRLDVANVISNSINNTSNEPLFVLTGGNHSVTIGESVGSTILIEAQLPSIVKVEAGSVTIKNMTVKGGGSFLSAKTSIVEVASGASAKLIRTVASNVNLAKQDATDSKVILDNCTHYSTRLLDRAVSVVSAGTDLIVVGDNFSNKAANTNSNTITTFGSFTTADTVDLI